MSLCPSSETSVSQPGRDGTGRAKSGLEYSYASPDFTRKFSLLSCENVLSLLHRISAKSPKTVTTEMLQYFIYNMLAYSPSTIRRTYHVCNESSSWHFRLFCAEIRTFKS